MPNDAVSLSTNNQKQRHSVDSVDAARLTERQVEQGFHHLLQTGLIQAQAEGLLEDDLSHWSRAELQVTTTALALYFAALRAHGMPPSITAPPQATAFVLSDDNCPPSFASLFALWQTCVPRVQRLSLELRHDLALILCDQVPQSSPVHIEVTALARDVKVVSVDIVQRQTFQARFEEDISAALAESVRAGSSQGHRYDAPPPSVHAPAPAQLDKPLPERPQQEQQNGSATATPPPPLPPLPPSRAPDPPKRHSLPGYRPLPRPPVPAIVVAPPLEEDTTLVRIRETLFAALGDCIATDVNLATLLRQSTGSDGGEQEWASRAYFASLRLAILDVSITRTVLSESLALPVIQRASSSTMTTDAELLHAKGSSAHDEVQAWQQSFVRTVNVGNRHGNDDDDDDDEHQQRLSLQACPVSHATLLNALLAIARQTQRLVRSDDARAIDDAQHDRKTEEDGLLIPALKRSLLGESVPQSVGADVDGYVQEASLMINRLALAVFEIPSFRQRQTEVFQVLRAITSV